MKIFNLMNSAQQLHESIALTDSIILENLTYFASLDNQTIEQLSESITHVLAGLSKTAQNMNQNSVASLLAGVEQLANKLPSMDDAEKKNTTIKVLTAAAMVRDDLTRSSLPNQAVVNIAQYGSKFPELVQKYLKMLNGSNAEQQITQTAQQLSSLIQRSMVTAQQAANTMATNPNI